MVEVMVGNNMQHLKLKADLSVPSSFTVLEDCKKNSAQPDWCDPENVMDTSDPTAFTPLNDGDITELNEGRYQVKGVEF